jgi:hypothetical protein
MYGCLSGAMFTMKADILLPTVTQNAMTGQVEKVYSLSETINCSAESIDTTSTTDTASGKKFRDRYEEYDVIHIMAGMPLSKRTRVTNIRDASGKLLWPQYERPAVPQVFEVRGCIPITSPFGQVSFYKILAARVEVQVGQ